MEFAHNLEIYTIRHKEFWQKHWFWRSLFLTLTTLFTDEIPVYLMSAVRSPDEQKYMTSTSGCCPWTHPVFWFHTEFTLELVMCFFPFINALCCGLCALISAYLNETFKGRKENSVEKSFTFVFENKQTNYAGLGEWIGHFWRCMQSVILRHLSSSDKDQECDISEAQLESDGGTTGVEVDAGQLGKVGAPSCPPPPCCHHILFLVNKLPLVQVMSTIKGVGNKPLQHANSVTSLPSPTKLPK